MKSPLRRSAPFSFALTAAASLAFAGGACGITTNFIGPEEYDPNYGYYWSDDSYWSDSAPGPGDDVTILERLDENSEPYLFYGPLLDVNVTVNSLDLDTHTSINNAFTGANNKNLFVTDTTVMGTYASLVNFAGRFSLGTLSNYDSGTRTMDADPVFYVGDREGAGTGILEFRGADIVTNGASFIIFGARSFVRDQNTGLNAFRNLAVNNGYLWLNDGYQLTTAGNLTNSGTIGLNASPQDTRTPELNISGNFVNNGYVYLHRNSTFKVAGGLSGTGSIQIFSLPVICEVLGVWTQTGGTVNLGGSGLDGFVMKAIAFHAENNTTVSGSGTIEAAVTITSGTISPGNSPGTITVQGNLTLEAGAKLEMEIAGTAHDRITQSTGAAGTVLGGVLEVTTIDDFDDEVLASSTYEILTSHLPLTGSFTNVASGARLNTADGKGSFLVNYGPGSAAPNKVVLSDYIAVNAPESFAQWLSSQDVTAPDNDADDDPNGDSVENLDAYFRGIPAVGDTKLKGLSSSMSGGNLVLTIRSPRTVTGVTLTSKVSGNLTDWQDGPVPVLTGTTPTRNLYQITIPSADPRKFARFVITQD